MTRGIIKGLKLQKKDGKLSAVEIAEAIEKAILSQAKPVKDWTQKKTFSPSTIGYGHGTCPRFWYIAFSGTESWDDDIDSMGLANMGVGSLVHDYIQKAMKHNGMLVQDEKEITIEDPPIRGFLDAIVNLNDENLVAEIKTTRKETFEFKMLSRKASPNHLIQILIYLDATGIQRGFLLYVNKNDETLLVIPVEMDAENRQILDNVYSWLRQVRSASDQNQLPLIPFVRARNAGQPTNKICRDCPVNKTCFSLEKGTIDIPLMEVPVL
jgi:CRISPR/Cas system-associated exonuclease Cas4 (RecB family)